MSSFLLLAIYFFSSYLPQYSTSNKHASVTQSLAEMFEQYEDDRNAMIAVTDVKDGLDIYDDFYDEFDNTEIIEQSMNMIFFGPPSSFLRLDSESILHILTYTKCDFIPISRTLLAWDIITDGKTAAFLQGREYLAFGALLNVIPEEDLYYVNFGDPSVLKYFASFHGQLLPRKCGVLAAAYRRYYGDFWYENSTNINELGYLLCGFPYTDLEKISPSTFKELSQLTLKKASKCNSNQTMTLFKIATHREAYGSPYKWTSLEISRLGAIFGCISSSKISAIALEAMPAITFEVLRDMDQEKLEFFTKQQIMRMNPKTRRMYIIRMQLKSSYDTNELAKWSRYGYNSKPSILQIIIVMVTLVFIN